MAHAANLAAGKLVRPASGPAVRGGGGYVFIALLAVLTTTISIYNTRTRHFTDDAGFFFRYAENLAGGHGYRWNVDEPPIWGASAPLWPAALAAVVRCGATPETAALLLGYAFTIAATALLAVCAVRCTGLLAGVAVCLFAATSYRYSAWAIQGMESPLTYLIVALAIAALTFRVSWPWLGMLAGLAVIHKLDMAPLSGLLLIVTLCRERRASILAAVLAAAIVGVAALAAWAEFGSIIPNSVSAKLQFSGSIAREWYWEAGLYISGRLILFVPALLSLPALANRPDVIGFCWTFGAALVAAYTLRPPPEGYEWYLSSVQPVLIFLAAVGAGSIISRTTRDEAGGRIVGRGAALLAVVSLAVVVLHQDRVPLAHHKFLLATLEADRVAAGHWIDENVPRGATVLTGFGNVAYHSHRRVIDYSFLNRKPPIEPYQTMIERLRPDVLGLCHWGYELPPADYPAPQNYRVAAVFDRAARSGVNHFCAVVLLRMDEHGATDDAGIVHEETR